MPAYSIPQTPPINLLIEAIKYQQVGLTPIPIAGKVPLVKWGEYQHRQPTLAELGRWFDDFTPTGIALVTGSASGLVCIDEDDVGALQRAGVHLPPTPTERTPRGGLHRWYRHPGAGARVESRANVIPGVDIKGDGGYAVVAPSAGYAWIDGLSPHDLDFAPLPGWVPVKHTYIRMGQEQYCSYPNAPTASPMGAHKEDSPRSGLPGLTARPTPKIDDEKIQKTIAATLSSRQFDELACIPEVALAVIRLCGAKVDRLGKAFYCPIPGHQEQPYKKTPSAALWQENGDRPVVLIDFHERSQIPSDDDKPGDTAPRKVWPLVDVYAACKSGRGRQLKRGERAVWWLRCLAELGLIEPPAMAAPRLPEEAPEEAQAVYEGFQLLLSLRAHYDPGQTSAPFSYRFADRWCGISWRQVEAGMTWLRCEGYLKSVDSITVGGRQCNLYAIGRVAANDDEKTDNIQLPAMPTNPDALRCAEDSADLHQMQKAHGDGIASGPSPRRVSVVFSSNGGDHHEAKSLGKDKSQDRGDKNPD